MALPVTWQKPPGHHSPPLKHVHSGRCSALLLPIGRPHKLHLALALPVAQQNPPGQKNDVHSGCGADALPSQTMQVPLGHRGLPKAITSGQHPTEWCSLRVRGRCSAQPDDGGALGPRQEPPCGCPAETLFAFRSGIPGPRRLSLTRTALRKAPRAHAVLHGLRESHALP